MRVPPPLTRGSEKFEGSSVLSEFEGEFGILLWQSLRNVLLWSATDPARRKGLFTPGADERRRVKMLSAEVDDALRAPLAVIARLLADPAGADRRRVAAACQRIAEWAEKRQSLATALAFMQAAALTSGNDARTSYMVGRLARIRAEFARAETWYRRAILLGRQTGDWETYADAFAGLGTLLMQRGNNAGAERAFLRSFRAAKRKGLRLPQAIALHQLFIIAAERKDVRQAEELAAAALRAGGPTNPRLPNLAHDVTYFWMEQGVYAPALSVLKALQPHLTAKHEQPLLLAHIAQAAAGAGDREEYEKYWRAAAKMLAEAATVEHDLGTRLGLTMSAMLAGDLDRAEEAGREFLRIAESRGETFSKVQAEGLLAEIEARKAEVAPTEPATVEPWIAEHAGGLAENFLRSLQLSGAPR